MTSITDDRHVAALTALVEAGIEPDVQELLVSGDPSRGVAPGALAKAVAAAAPTTSHRRLLSELTECLNGVLGAEMSDSERLSDAIRLVDAIRSSHDLSGVIPEGWQLVPKVATEAMRLAAHDGPLLAGEHHMTVSNREWLGDMYATMLEAAPGYHPARSGILTEAETNTALTVAESVTRQELVEAYQSLLLQNQALVRSHQNLEKIVREGENLLAGANGSMGGAALPRNETSLDADATGTEQVSQVPDCPSCSYPLTALGNGSWACDNGCEMHFGADDLKPGDATEPDETWQAWYYASFDLAREKIRTLMESAEERVSDELEIRILGVLDDFANMYPEIDPDFVASLKKDGSYASKAIVFALSDEAVNAALMTERSGSFYSDFARMRAALMAALPTAMDAMHDLRIGRPLVWEERRGRPNLFDEWTANTPLGAYRVVAMPDGFAWLLDGRTGTDKRKSLEEAQAAAQEDFDARVGFMLRPDIRIATKHTTGTPL